MTERGIFGTMGTTTSSRGDPWLVAIDMQRIFGEAPSPWASPDFEVAASGISRLLTAFTDRAVFTRYVAPARPDGAWRDYFGVWPFALVPETDPLYDLDERFRDQPRIQTRQTFGKWDAGLAAAIDGSREIVLAGVSTDCCVLSTALAAADAGVRVRVVVDACAAPTAIDHERALITMGMYAPLIVLTSVDEVLCGLDARQTAPHDTAPHDTAPHDTASR
jgi:nicotinamidase-related amidase